MREDDETPETEDDDILGEATPAPKKKARKKTDPAKKPSKAVVTKPAKADKAKKAAKEEPAPKKGAKKATAKKANGKAKEAAPRGRPKTVSDDVSTTQPEDKIFLGWVKKLKQPMPASQFANDHGIHRRVIRAQAIRLSKDKANGFFMKKDGFNWVIGPKG